MTRTRIRDGAAEIHESESSFSGPAVAFGVQGFFGDERQNGVQLDFLGLFAEGDDEEFFDILDGTSNISVTYVR